MEPGVATIISPPLDCDSFEVGGITYTKTDTLALGRARLLQRFQTELQFNMSIPTVQKALMEMRGHLNAVKFVDAVNVLQRLMDGADLLGANRMREAEIVALFFNAPGEDPTTYDHSAITAKVAAWGAVDADFFTRQAFVLLLRTSTRYPPLESLSLATPSTPDPSPSE